jgi:hypothetical protein
MGAVYSSLALDGALRRVLALGPPPPPLPRRPPRGPSRSRFPPLPPPLVYADDVAMVGRRGECASFADRVRDSVPWKALGPPRRVVDYLGVRVDLCRAPTPTLSVAHRRPPLPFPLRSPGRAPAAAVAQWVGWAAWATHAVCAPGPPAELLDLAASAKLLPPGSSLRVSPAAAVAARVCWADLSRPWHVPPPRPLPRSRVVHCDAAAEGAWRRVACVWDGGHAVEDFPVDTHINTLEAAALWLAIRVAPRDRPLRLVTDSSAAAAAAVRGRARGACPSDFGVMVSRLRGAAARRQWPTAVAWIPTLYNAADAPSRGDPPAHPPQLPGGRFLGYMPYPARP